MSKIILAVTTIFSAVILVVSCAKDKVPVTVTPASDCADTIHYALDIVPLVQQNCSTTGCHDQSASAGYSFLTYTDVSQNATIMLRTMKYEAGVQPMPQGVDKLADSLIQHFECWILQGSLNN